MLRAVWTQEVEVSGGPQDTQIGLEELETDPGTLQFKPGAWGERPRSEIECQGHVVLGEESLPGQRGTVVEH